MNKKSLSTECSIGKSNSAVSWKRTWECKDARSRIDFNHSHPGHPYIIWTAGENYINPETGKWVGKEVMDSLNLADAVQLRDWLNKQIETMEACKDLDTMLKKFDQDDDFTMGCEHYRKWTLMVNSDWYVQQKDGGQKFSIYYGQDEHKFIESFSSLEVALNHAYGYDITQEDECNQPKGVAA